MATTAELEEFMQGPLVIWLRSCLDNPDALTDYNDLADGVMIYNVLLLIDPEPLHYGVAPSLGNPTLRVRNFDCIIKNIKTLYEEELCQLVMMVPDCVQLGREPDSRLGVEQMRLLLLLLLGCAVQCPNKQSFIEQIKSLEVDAQHALVDCIKQVTESQEIVLTQESCECLSPELMLTHIRRLVKERDRYLQHWVTQDDRKTGGGNSSHSGGGGGGGGGSGGQSSSNQLSGGNESQHLAVELADWKARLRKLRQELEEKSEALSEAREELEQNRTIVSKLRSEMNELKQAARAGKAYRDEVDALREKAERCEKLESEVTRYRDKLSDLEYYKSRVEELRQDNRVLEETREMLEEQLMRSRKRAEHMVQLEADILKYKQTINDLALEREAGQERMQELFEENAQLALLSKSTSHQNSTTDSDQLEDTETGSGDNSLSEQLTSNAQARALRLELENRRLASTVESLQEAALHQTNQHILDLEKDKKKLSLQVEDLEENKRKLLQHNAELETTVKNAQRDTKKMQELRDTLQLQLQIRSDEADNLLREKQRMERRMEELEVSLENAKQQAEKVPELEEARSRAANLERDITRLKHALEVKAVSLDKLSTEIEVVMKEKSELAKQLEKANLQISRLQQLEHESRELESRSAVDKAAITALQSELVAEKLNTQRLKGSLEKLGLALDHFSDPDNALDRILSSPEVLKAVKSRLALEEESSNDSDMTTNAHLQVELATLQSQVASLNSQHTALQLANSQLVAEKEEILNEHAKQTKDHQQLLVDQLTLQKLHEQLTGEYETLVKEREQLKAQQRDVRGEHRTLREQCDLVRAHNTKLLAQVDALNAESRTLNNLRAEHSKLKEDFRNLFAASDKIKTDYRSVQEEYRALKLECGRHKLENTELQGELVQRNDVLTTQQVQISKLTSQNEALIQMKNGLEEDRRSLMEHVSVLLSQYHELLTHSLEDKEHYHTEEKLFTDKLNNLCRQKEKLEEKIMEHYRKLDSCPTKKKSFGASLVRRVRKAGSDLISKSRRSWHDEAARRGTDSDTSLEDVRTRQDGLSLGTPGTRRTVYYSGDENSTTNDQEDNQKNIPEGDPQSSAPQQQDPGQLLVYNRLTTVLGSAATPPHSPTPTTLSQQNNKQANSPENKNSVWYEYGCV
ncbi:LOW QUALITY PROTEIN: girdin [Nilaparvata lugens]|uniref:LOW QUALITY PROTEIN: girdin n=1 Tax=Nilaparvata lugens TaxID=108931 RepID=UPI00193E9F48|nr:LOW QUALITY PROTEIN: girdin [Nilaparvata lugens]